MASFSFVEDMAGIDWAELKQVLVADDFDNGRTPAQLAASFGNSAVAVIAYAHEPDRPPRIVGTARALSDGVCNAYVVDVWTHSGYRLRGIGRTLIERLLHRLPGQHVYLWTDTAPEFYTRLGFRPVDAVGMAKVVGRWLDNTPLPD